MSSHYYGANAFDAHYLVSKFAILSIGHDVQLR